MWGVNPKLLCRKHLLGEHVEVHMFVGTIRKGISLAGYVRDGLVEVHSLRKRHEELAAEMARRGYNHQSPLPSFEERVEGRVDSFANLQELIRRCPTCRENIERGRQ